MEHGFPTIPKTTYATEGLWSVEEKIVCNPAYTSSIGSQLVADEERPVREPWEGMERMERVKFGNHPFQNPLGVAVKTNGPSVMANMC